MADYEVTGAAALQAWLEVHEDWSRAGDAITAVFTFKDFGEAFAFMVQVAFLAEKHDHHPTMENTYNKVRLSLNTHDAGGKITARDLKLAQAIGEAAATWKK